MTPSRGTVRFGLIRRAPGPLEDAPLISGIAQAHAHHDAPRLGDPPADSLGRAHAALEWTLASSRKGLDTVHGPARMRRTLLGLAATAALLSSTALQAPAQDLAPTVGVVISQVEDDLDAIRGALRDIEQAPEGGRFTIWDKDSYRSDLDGYLDDAFELIAPGFYADARTRLEGIDAAIAAAQAERSELVVARMGAVSDVGGPSLMDRARGREHPRGSREDVEARIAAAEARVVELEAERDALVRGFARELSERFGIGLTFDQARAALYQVNGASMVESAIVAEVLTAIEARLREIVGQDLEAGVARRYYGVAAVTRLMIVRMHERHLASYDEVWLPRLDELEAENRALVEETEGLLDATGTEGRQATLNGNLAIQRQIAETMESYRAILEERRDVTREALVMAREDAEVAVNTLKTLESAVRLSDAMTRNMEEFRHLMSVEAPALMPLEDERVFDQFLDISRQLEAGA